MDWGRSEVRMDASSTVGLPRALISRDAILHNIKIIRSATGPGVKVCAMIKADAYGHGAWIVADALTNFSGPKGEEPPIVDMLGVATIDEAAALPAQSPVPILIFQPVENAMISPQRERVEYA